jgi:hypothetical protein
MGRRLSDEELLRRDREARRQRQIRRLRANEREMQFWAWFIPLCVVLAIIALIWGAITH